MFSKNLLVLLAAILVAILASSFSVMAINLEVSDYERLAYSITEGDVADEDVALLGGLNNAQINELNLFIQENVNIGCGGFIAEFKEDQDVGQIIYKTNSGGPTIDGCQWDYVSYWNESLTKSKNYRWGSHYAVYFTVRADASCYSKRSWLCSWSPTEGYISGWLLLLYKDRYWNGSAWVKDIALLIPSTCWWNYWYLSSSTKASSYYIYWNNWNNGCCE